ncbi:hypothetical protein [Tepidimonas sp.]|uniref:hypothetical protein n=1 Tax=Tepidimonas sp. TaxID=2002775 RepID=UPI002FE14351
MYRYEDCDAADYGTRVVRDPSAVAAARWNTLLHAQPAAQARSPFMRRDGQHALTMRQPRTGLRSIRDHAVGWRRRAVRGSAAISHGLIPEAIRIRRGLGSGPPSPRLCRHPKAVVAVPFPLVAAPRRLALGDASARPHTVFGRYGAALERVSTPTL